MSRKQWEKHEIDYLVKNYNILDYKTIAKNLNRTEVSISKKCNSLGITKRKQPPQIGDVINGWEIISMYTRKVGSQNITYAKVKSTINDKVGKYRLTQLTKGNIGWPDRRRPDVSHKNYKHGLTNTKLYSVWSGMKNRCLNKKQSSYKNYGGRGIKFCDEWLDFMNFYNWAINNGYKEDLQLDRIDNDGDYCPENCRWVSQRFQINNRRVSVNIVAFGETKNASDWALDSRCQCSYSALTYRVKNGWNVEKAILTPSHGFNQKFRRYKSLCIFIQNKYPEIIDEFLNN